MLALVATPNQPDKIALQEVAEPTPAKNEALVAVKAISINRGELRGLGVANEGWRPGWDVSGVILQPAADGSGPPAGTRIVGFTPGSGWAEQVAVSTGNLAGLPDTVSFGVAASLPVAGLTALRCLRLGGSLLGKRVLITGASGGVGRYAVQLAALSQAEVTAVVGKPERGADLPKLGATSVIVNVEQAIGTFDLILEAVGGATLGAAIQKLTPGHGVLVVYGNSSGEPTTINASILLGRQGTHLIPFVLPAPGAAPFGADLSYLISLLAKGQLDAQIHFEGSWRQIGAALSAMRDRQLAGKAVLYID